MTDEQLTQRFTQIAQALEHMLEASDQHAVEMAEIRKAQTEFAEADRKLQARIEALAEVATETNQAVAGMHKEWQAYLTRQPRQ